ncbi:MAG: hypothetical protein BGO25_06245 [Acidobacteriales bacterium 59-55]|nr:MAG: hypothetical protein BGO25_06245 [Acidobacteriales bacterium 59-55]
MAMSLFRKIRTTVDIVMVLCWGAAFIVRLIALIPAHDWTGLGGVIILGFIAVGFAVDFQRVRRDPPSN